MSAALDCYAVTHPGLERVTAAELVAIGLRPAQSEPGGVSFATDLHGLYSANLRLRTASRVLVRIARFHAHSFPELERHARRVSWSDYATPGRPVAFRVTSRKSKLYHQRAVAERLARAAGAAEGENGALFVVRLLRDECTISADASGELLHRRGYRLATAKAPLRETLAAGMLLAAEWSGASALLDPMCGSGTIPVEAALIARRIAPGANRSFAFEKWSSFDRASWSEVRGAARADEQPVARVPIFASDRDAGAVAATLENAARAGVAADIVVQQCAISAVEPPAPTGMLFTNPPYGVRVGERHRLRDLYAQLGNVARRRFDGWKLVMLSPHAELEGQVGLEFETLARTSNGGVSVAILSAPVTSRARLERARR